MNIKNEFYYQIFSEYMENFKRYQLFIKICVRVLQKSLKYWRVMATKAKKTTKQIISQAGNFDLMLFIH